MCPLLRSSGSSLKVNLKIYFIVFLYYYKMSSFDRYLELSEKEGEYQIMYSDPIVNLTEFEDLIKSPNTDLCICERAVTCHCRDICDCDSDDFALVKGITQCGPVSGCFYIISLSIDHLFNKKKSLRLFTLDKITDEEIPLLDIKVEKVSKKKYRYKQLSFLHRDPISSFFIDSINVKEQYIEIKFNYMNEYIGTEVPDLSQADQPSF